MEALAEAPVYCDVSLPVPIDTAFTYRLPETLRRRVQPGCRVLVPFGTRKLTGVVLATHSRPPAGPTKEALRLLDEEPALDESLLELGRWISAYYCAPLGETLRAMTPLAADVRRGRIYSLTPSGSRYGAAVAPDGDGQEDPAAAILRMLDGRALSATYLAQKVTKAAAVLRSLEKKGFVESEDVAAERDPLRASAARLRVEFVARATEKIPKPERELLAYLELHPGQHNVATLEDTLPKASTAARALARRQLARLALEPVSSIAAPPRAPHTLNPHQQEAFDAHSARR